MPTQIDYIPEMKSSIKRMLNIEEEEVDERLNNHLKYLELDDKTNADEKNGIEYDIWGIGWDLVLTEGFHRRYYPLLNSDDVKKYKFPDPEDYLLKLILF